MKRPAMVYALIICLVVSACSHRSLESTSAKQDLGKPKALVADVDRFSERLVSVRGGVRAGSARQYVNEVESAMRRELEQTLSVEIIPMPIDQRQSADAFYESYEKMISFRSDTTIYIGDAKKGLNKTEVISMLPGNRQCSGIVIASNAIATAWHCVEQHPTTIFVQDLDGSTHPVDLQGEPFVRASAAGTLLDLGVLVRKDPFPVSKDALPAFASDSTIRQSADLQLVGYGGSTATSGNSGLKRLGIVPKLSSDCAGPNEKTDFHCIPGFEMVGGSRPLLDAVCPSSKKPLPPGWPQGACHGDSGGAVYVERDGRLLLAGLIESIIPDGQCGCARATNVYVRLDKQIDFLKGLKSSDGTAIQFDADAFADIEAAGAH